jgi:hypothetical protein
MKQPVASNCALLLAILSWPLIIYGLMSQLGDYHPSVSREVITANRRLSVSILSAGFLCFLAFMWLAGYSYTGARVRALLAAACCTGLLVLGIFTLWL